MLRTYYSSPFRIECNRMMKTYFPPPMPRTCWGNHSRNFFIYLSRSLPRSLLIALSALLRRTRVHLADSLLLAPPQLTYMTELMTESSSIEHTISPDDQKNETKSIHPTKQGRCSTDEALHRPISAMKCARSTVIDYQVTMQIPSLAIRPPLLVACSIPSHPRRRTLLTKYCRSMFYRP